MTAGRNTQDFPVDGARLGASRFPSFMGFRFLYLKLKKGGVCPLQFLDESRKVRYIESKAFWKRLAWDLSAFAKVSNQSAISSKPSSLAVDAIPGYMSVYSWVSPATAAFRLSEVEPMGNP